MIIYVLLSGMLPFDSDDNKETARQTIYEPVPFTNRVWNFVTDDAKDLISSNSLSQSSFYRTTGEGSLQENHTRGGARTSMDMQEEQGDCRD